MRDFKHIPQNGETYTAEEIKQAIFDNNVQFIKLQFVDINGQVKNLSVPAGHIEKVLTNEIMLDGSSIKGFRDIETSDMFFYPDVNSFQILPWQERDGRRSARLICDIYNADGTPFEGCPRCNLKRIMKEAEKLGFSMNLGPEAEFFLFNKDKDGNPTDKPMDKADYYDVGPDDLGEHVRSDIVRIPFSISTFFWAGVPSSSMLMEPQALGMVPSSMAVTFSLAIFWPSLPANWLRP